MIRIAFCQTNRLFILLERAETKICISMANSMFKQKKDIATVPDLYLTTVNILTHLISRYYLPVKLPHLVSGLWPVVWGALVNFPYSSLFLALYFHTCISKTKNNQWNRKQMSPLIVLYFFQNKYVFLICCVPASRFCCCLSKLRSASRRIF